MASLLDNCKFNPTAGGTTDWTFSTAVQGYQSPSAANVVNGTKYKYFAVSADLSQWEIGEGAYNTGTGVLPRTTVLYNSSGTGAVPGQSGAGTKINFTNPPFVAIVGLAEDVAVPAILRSYLAGLTLSTAGSSTTFSVAAGSATDGGNTDFMVLSSAITKDFASTWTVGNNGGALDTGSTASNTWYHVHLIKRVDTQVVDALVSLSATNPTLPANYTLSRRIGSMKTDGSSKWTLFSQNGDEFLWSVPVNDVNVTNLGTTATLYTLTVATGLKVNALVRYFMSNASVGTVLLINSPDEAVASSNSPIGNVTAQNPVAGATGGTMNAMNVRTNTSAQIRAVSSSASTTFALATYGWIDRRGRDA